MCRFMLLCIFTSIVLFSSAISWAQGDEDLLATTFFFGRFPSAKSEALGRSFMAETGEAVSSFFNPAGLAKVEGISFTGAAAEPLYGFFDAKYLFGALAWNIGRRGTFGFSMNAFDSGRKGLFGELGFSIESTHYILSYGYELGIGLSIGVNVNYIKEESVDRGPEFVFADRTMKYADIGLLQSFTFLDRERLQEKLNIAFSVINVTNSKIKRDRDNDFEQKMPVLLRLGASHYLKIDEKLLFDNLTTLQISIYGEYQDVLNFDWRTGFKAGLEVTLFEMLSLRTGYFSEKRIVGDSPDNKSRWSDSTFGFGINIPFSTLTENSLPLSIRYDYVNMDQPLFTKSNRFNFGDFSVNTITLGWDLNKPDN